MKRLSRRDFGFGLCACTGAALAGCTTTGDGVGASASLQPGYRPSAASDEGGLWQQMARQEEQLKQSSLLVRDRALNAYVHDIACRLAGDFCADLRVYIVRTPHFNASMAPNGVMEIWTGLLLRTQTEAQLAAVIGHEIGHYVHRHSLQRWRDARTKMDIGAVLGLGFAAAGVGALGNVSQLALLASISSFSRENEREADAFGLERIAKAGYDPLAAAQVWQQLIDEETASGEDRSHNLLFASHPAPEERIDTLRALAGQYGSVQPGAERHRATLAPIWPTLIGDELKLRQYKRTEALLGIALKHSAAPGQVQFYRGEVYRMRDGEGDADRAVAAYRDAIAADGAPPEAWRSLGLVQWKAKQAEPAREAFRKYIALRPDASDRHYIVSLIQSVQ